MAIGERAPASAWSAQLVGTTLHVDAAPGEPNVFAVSDGEGVTVAVFDFANAATSVPPACTLAEDGELNCPRGSVLGTPVADPAVNGTPADPVQVGGSTPGSPAPRVASVRARLVNRTVVVTFRSLTSTSVTVDVLEASGATIVSRRVSVSSSGQRRVVLPVGTAAPARVRLTPSSALAAGTPVEAPVTP